MDTHDGSASGRLAAALRGVAIGLLWIVVSTASTSARGAATVNLSGTWQWTDTSITTGASYSGTAQIVESVSGSFSWTWVDGWQGNGSVTGSTWTMSGASPSYTATWSAGTITQTGTSVTITANWKQSDGEIGTTTATLVSSAPHLSFTVEPSTTLANTPFNPVVQVSVLNAQGGPDPSNSESISLSLSGGTSGAVLSPTTATASGGVATFSGMEVNLAGQNYVLTATDASNPAIASTASTAFNIAGCEVNGAAAQLCLQKTGQVTADGLSYMMTIQNGTATTVSGIQVQDTVLPSFNVKVPQRALTSPKADPITWPNCAPTCTQAQPGILSWSKALPSLAAGATPLTITYPLTPDAVTVTSGARLSIANWSNDGWQATSAGELSATTVPTIVRGGGDLVYSDNPEYLDPTTSDLAAPGTPLGQNVEGVLYRQSQDADGSPLTSTGSFRIYMNHENRTTMRKRLYYVLTNPSTTEAVLVSAAAEGIGDKPGDPIAAGQAALTEYFDGPSATSPNAAKIPPLPVLPSGQPCTGSGFAATIPPGATCDFFVYELKPVTITPTGPVADVINLIADLASTGPIQVGFVAIDGGAANAVRYASFESHPLAYVFAGGLGLTYTDDPGLVNESEAVGHVHGTFPYNHVQVRINYDIASANRYGLRLGDNASSTSIAAKYEYALSRDLVPATNIGNFGVEYVVSIVPFGAASGMATQVLLEARGAGPSSTNPRVTNAVAAEVTTSTSPAAFPVPCTDKLRDPNVGVGLGYFTGNDTFVVNLIPPAGDTMPLVVIVAPAYVQNTAQTTAPYASPPSTVVLPLPDPNTGAPCS